ncbi:MAG: RNA-binding cell elongation regulator Jag/EloR [Armatimonadota bacterium]
MEPIVVTGRTNEEAVELAAKELGVSIDAVEYEVIQQGNKGFLGLGQIPTQIKAWVKEGIEPKKSMEQEGESGVSMNSDSYSDSYDKYAENESFSEIVTNLLSDIIEKMGIDARIEVKSDNDEEIEIEIKGEDVAILIGKRGQTLDALQYLLAIAGNKSVQGRKRVLLDAEGYREKHRKTLESMAIEYAKEVKLMGKEAVLDPQSPRDRRIIHMALANDPDVYTYSEGEGDERHVVISPKDT